MCVKEITNTFLGVFCFAKKVFWDDLKIHEKKIPSLFVRLSLSFLFFNFLLTKSTCHLQFFLSKPLHLCEIFLAKFKCWFLVIIIIFMFFDENELTLSLICTLIHSTIDYVSNSWNLKDLSKVRKYKS